MRTHLERVGLFVSVMAASGIMGLFSAWLGHRLTPASEIERVMTQTESGFSCECEAPDEL